jgi:hypothetical protein
VNPNAGFVQPLLEPGTGTGYQEFVGYSAIGLPVTRRVPGQAFESTRFINPTACGGPDTVRVIQRSTTAGTLPQNLGVPGLRLTQIEQLNLGNVTATTNTTNFNPYFSRMLAAGDSRSYLQVVQASAANATFFTFLQGLDDLLPYVRSGGSCGTVPTATQLNQNARKLLDVLTANGRPGIIAQLPLLNTLPLLRLGRGLELQARLRTAFGDTASLYVQNPFGPGAVLITGDDYVLATALSRVGQRSQAPGTSLMLPYGRDPRHPLANADVLINDEYRRANQVLNSYNTELRRLAKDVYRMPLVDPATGASAINLDLQLFNQVVNQISVNGVVYTTDPVNGNVFSMDYYSLTPRGNALLANVFIRAINRGYGANLATVDVNSLPTTAR